MKLSKRHICLPIWYALEPEIVEKTIEQIGSIHKNKFPRKQESCPLEVNRSALHVWEKTQRYGIDKFCMSFIAITKREKSKYV